MPGDGPRGAAPFTLAGWPDERIADPYPLYRSYREAATVHRVPGEGSGPDSYYVFGYAPAARALSSPRLGRRIPGGNTPLTHRAIADTAVREMVEDWLVFLDPPRHTRLRAILSREFTPRMVAGLRPRLAAIARHLLTNRQELDLVEDFAAPFPVLVISELLGLPAGDGSWLRAASLRLQQGSSSRAGQAPEGAAQADAAARELTWYFREQIGSRRARPGRDLISLLLGHEGLAETEIAATCVHLLTAGHETTTHLISKSVLALLRNPELLAHLRADPALLAEAVEELARYDPPVQAVTRWAQRDERLGDHLVPRGSKVTVLLGAANRDPGQFADPDTPRLHRRQIGPQLAFGLGIHYCLGAALARAEVELALAELLGRLAGAQLLEQPVRYAQDLLFHGPERLPLRW